MRGTEPLVAPETASTARNPAVPALAAILSLVVLATAGMIYLRVARAHRVTTLRVLGAPSFLLDAQGKRRLRELGLAIDPVSRPGSRVLDEADYGQYAAVFATGTAIADSVEQRLRTRQPRTGYRRSTPVVSPVTALSWTPVARRLQEMGLASQQNGYWTFDLAAFATAAAGGMTWTPPGQTGGPAQPLGLSTTRPRDSDATVAAVSLLARILDDHASAETGDPRSQEIDLDRTGTKAMIATVAALFRAQRSPYATPGRLTAAYRQGMATMPLGLGFEHEWISSALPTEGMARTAAGETAGDMTLMYLTPAAIVPTAAFATGTEGERLLAAIETDPELRRLITRSGYRSMPAARAGWDERLLIERLHNWGLPAPTAADLLGNAGRSADLPSQPLSAILARIDQLDGYS